MLSPLYIQNVTTDTKWKEQLLSKSPKIQLINDKILITVNRNTFNKKPSIDLGKVFPVMEDILKYSNNFAGFDNSSFRNMATLLKTHYVEDAISKDPEYNNGVYMYAGDGFVGMQPESVFDLIDAKELKKKWAIWHETSHLYQDNDWTFSSTSEVIVNLFSLFVQENFGEPLRIFEREEGSKTMVEKAKTFINSPNHEFLDEKKFEDMVWIRLVMFQQLKQQFGKQFYTNLFQYYRQNPLNINANTDDDEKIQKFIQRSSLIAKTNLINFYTKWGIPVSDETIKFITKLKLPSPTNDISQIFMK